MNIAQPLLIPFYPNRLKGYNYVSNTPFPIDDNSHGTHVTGIAAQVIKLGQSKGTQFQSYKAMDSYGVGSLWTICQAVDKAMQDGVQVLNMSLGFQAPKGISPTAQRSPILEYIFNVAKEHNMLITVAAGNDGANIDLSENKTWYLPANLSVINDNLITVAATTCDGRLAPFSNYGNQSVQVAAPGVNILSTLSGIPTNSNPLMGCKSGTSMATPYVTGLAALFGSQSGQWNYWATKKRILAKASPNQTLRGFLLGEGGVLTTSCDNIRSIAPSNTGGTTTKTTLAVAPNPMTDRTDIIFFAPNNDGAELTVCDLFGRVIDRQNVPTTEGGNDFQWTAPSNLPKGIYNVTIKVGDEIHSTRLSKF